MNKLVLATLAAGLTLTVSAPAFAADGCGRGYHLGPRGHCRPNVRGGPVVVAPRLVIGTYYNGRGYWDGRGYYKERYRYRNGWRYR